MTQFHEYIPVFAVAAVVTWISTFVVRALARRHTLLVLPDARRIHERPTPTGGGAAMYLGLLAAVAVASQLPAFSAVFRGSSAPMGIVVAATVIFAVGLADDFREMSPPAKLSGQVLAGTVLFFLGPSMIYFHVPLAETTLVLGGTDWAVLATVLWVVVMANSVNFIDGLDGLAAGVVGIGAAAFFVYSHQLGVLNTISSGNAGPLIAVIILGLCVGFLPHNFHPAKVFMGDAGSMLLGVLLAACTLAVVGQDSYDYSGKTYFFFAPILIPFFILGIPLLDTVFAIVRRAGKRSSPAVADLNHLHHRLVRLGHGHRAAVVILWAWTALLSGLVLWSGVTNSHNEIIPFGVGGLSILLYTLFAPRGRTTVATETGPGPAGPVALADSDRGGTGTGPRTESAKAEGAGGRPAARPPDRGGAPDRVTAPDRGGDPDRVTAPDRDAASGVVPTRVAAPAPVSRRTPGRGAATWPGRPGVPCRPASSGGVAGGSGVT
ncbi:MAG: glycosyltransferase family 4 protein [Acidimicrobiales bacterium]